MPTEEKYEKTEFGWNERFKRPATRTEIYHTPREVCNCTACSTDPHYGEFYCKRTKAYGYIMMIQNAYWRHGA